MKTDARVRYTVHMIQNIFLELLKRKTSCQDYGEGNL